MLPQITGLALSLGTMMGGALVAEMIFSYPGLGMTLLTAVNGQDYPLLSACTLIITIMVLIANLAVELLYVGQGLNQCLSLCLNHVHFPVIHNISSEKKL